MSRSRSTIRFLRCIAASWAVHGTALALAAAFVGWRVASSPSRAVRVALVHPVRAPVEVLPEVTEDTLVRPQADPVLDPERDPPIEAAPPDAPLPPPDPVAVDESAQWSAIGEVFVVPPSPGEETEQEPRAVTSPPPASSDSTPTIVVENEPAVLVDGPPPRYPARSVWRGEQGSVLCRLTIDADGRVTRAEVVESSGFPRLDAAAVEALGKWRVRPRTEGGVALPSELLHSVTFRLEER